MELLSAATEKKLLEAGIESLHDDCMTWLQTIAFWQDEIYFYKELLNDKLYPNILKEDRSKLETLLSYITYDKLNFFEGELLRHEKKLNLISTSDLVSDEFRQKHKLYLQYFLNLEDKMQQLKSKIFKLYKLVRKSPSFENETIRTIYERRSVRKYKKDAIDKIRIRQIIMAGKMAPTAINQQVWKFYILTDKEKIKSCSRAISEAAQDTINVSFKGAAIEDDVIFHSAPVVILITSPLGNESATLDVGMCAQNIMLAAKSLGYDSCPVGLAKFLEKMNGDSGLNIPPGEEIKLAVVIGYGNEKPEVKERKNNNIIFLNQ